MKKALKEKLAKSKKKVMALMPPLDHYKPHYFKELVGFLKPAKPFDLRDYVVEYEDPRTKDYVVEYQGQRTKDYLEENRKIHPHTAPGP